MHPKQQHALAPMLTTTFYEYSLSCFTGEKGARVQQAVPGQRENKQLLVFALLYTLPIHPFS